MKVDCVSCGYEINLEHTGFEDYTGPVKCFCCGAMMEIKISKGFVYLINPSAILEDQAKHNLSESSNVIPE
jgi:DNA-directed RNA polymerase subunit N (RpoN/RPB10)